MNDGSIAEAYGRMGNGTGLIIAAALIMASETVAPFLEPIPMAATLFIVGVLMFFAGVAEEKKTLETSNTHD